MNKPVTVITNDSLGAVHQFAAAEIVAGHPEKGFGLADVQAWWSMLRHVLYRCGVSRRVVNSCIPPFAMNASALPIASGPLYESSQAPIDVTCLEARASAQEHCDTNPETSCALDQSNSSPSVDQNRQHQPLPAAYANLTVGWILLQSPSLR